MKKFYIFISILLISLGLKAQDEHLWNWLNHSGGNGWDVVNGLAIDNENNIYVCGSYENAIQIQSKDLVAVGGRDIYYAAYNQQGDLQWIQNIGSPGYDNSTEIIVTKDQKLCIAGTVSEGARFGLLKSTLEKNYLFIFSSKLSGQPLWHILFEGSGHKKVTSMTSDLAGNIYLSGIFSKELKTDGFSLNTEGDDDVFIAKLSPQGKCLWLKQIGSPDKDKDAYISTLSGNKIVLATILAETYNNTELKRGRKQDIIVLQSYLPNGNLINEKIISGKSAKKIKGLNQSINGTVYLLGSFNGFLDVGTESFTSQGGNDIILLKLNNVFDIIWTQSIGSQWHENANSLALDASYNPVISGTISKNIEFAGKTVEANENKRQTCFVATYDKTGKEKWLKQFDGNFSRGLQSDDLGNLYLTGSFTKKIIVKDDTIKSMGKEDVFLTQLYNCAVLKSGLPDTIKYCSADKSTLVASDEFKNYYWNQANGTREFSIEMPGTIFFSAETELGCIVEDTIEAIEVPSPQFDLGKNMELDRTESVVISSPITAQRYNWNLGGKKTDFLFEAYRFAPGVHIVGLELTNSQGCVYKDSLEIKIANLFDRGANGLSVFPNPNQGTFNWYLTEFPGEKIKVEFFDNQGSLIKSYSIDDYRAYKKIEEQFSGLSQGVYFMNLSYEGGKKTKMFVIQ